VRANLASTLDELGEFTYALELLSMLRVDHPHLLSARYRLGVAYVVAGADASKHWLELPLAPEDKAAVVDLVSNSHAFGVVCRRARYHRAVLVAAGVMDNDWQSRGARVRRVVLGHWHERDSPDWVRKELVKLLKTPKASAKSKGVGALFLRLAVTELLAVRVLYAHFVVEWFALTRPRERAQWLELLRQHPRRRQQSLMVRTARWITQYRRMVDDDRPSVDFVKYHSLFHRVLRRRPVGSAAEYNVACFHAVAQDIARRSNQDDADELKDEAIRILGQALRNPTGSNPSPEWLMVDPDFESIRDDEGFRRVVRQLRAERDEEPIGTLLEIPDRAEVEKKDEEATR
jgi:hypothetical protein